MGFCQQGQISLESLLKNMDNIASLPILENSKTALASTWDRNGGNNDGTDFKRIEGNYNILLDTAGPGYISRIFTGILGALNESVTLNSTHLQIFIDGNTTPVIDCPVRDFFTKNTITQYPFVFGADRTYPGFLFPIPFQKHVKVQLWSEDKYPIHENWGNYWQVTYTLYPAGTPVKSFALPLSAAEQQQMKTTGEHWAAAEKNSAQAPTGWNKSATLNLSPGNKQAYILKGPGMINAFRINILPNTPAALKDVRLRIYWDGMSVPSVDVPVGYFFGNADYASKEKYNSLLMGVDTNGGYCRFPMPFAKQAKIEFDVANNSEAKQLILDLNYTKVKKDAGYGYFHATWAEQWATEHTKGDGKYPGELNIPGMPTYGERKIPVHIAMDRNNIKGKYVGMLLHIGWPGMFWWGEGDVLIWSDEHGWPPSYHGTGTEEYFNSGWGDFDRKAVSGYIKKGRGNVLVYSFHIADAFNFNNSIKVGVERWNVLSADNQARCTWGSTTFWYASKPEPAESKQELLSPRLHEDAGKLVWK